MPIYTVKCRVTVMGKRGLVQCLNGATEIETVEEVTVGQLQNNEQLLNDLMAVFQKNPGLKNKVVFMVEIVGLKAPTKKILASIKPENEAINRM